MNVFAARTVVRIVAAAAALGTGAHGDARAQDEPKPWGPAPAVVIREGEHYRVLCHFDTARLADEALAVVEPVWDVTNEVLGGRAKDAGLKDVHLYRGAADYAAADRSATGGRFARNLAFSLEAGPVAHIALQPELDDSVFARTGLSAATRRTLAHEAVHLALHESMPNHEDQPAWMQEGLGTWIADRALVGAGLAPPPEAAPLSATRTVRVQRLRARGALPTPRAILFTDLDDLTFNERYATWWLFWRFFAEDGGGKRMKSAIRAAWSLGGGTNYGARLAHDIEKAWGAKTLDALGADFEAFVRSLRPEWEEIYRTLDIEGATWTQMAWDDSNALAWRTTAVGRRKYTIAGTLEILYGTNPQMNLLLARRDDGFVSIAFRAQGGVTVFDQRAPDNEWRRVGWMEAPQLEVGREVPFRVAVDGDRITIAVADGEPLSWTLEGIDLTGPWGVGVQSAAAGVWRNVKLR